MPPAKRAVTPPLKGRRGKAYGARIVFDISGFQEFAKRLTKESELARPALVEAHRDIASALQAAVITALNEAIKERGRVQRDGALVAALGSKNSVVATVTGFTYGFLENAKGSVRLYARNLERGTDVHIGQPFNAFRNAAGRLVPPVSGDRAAQIDPKLVAFRDLNRQHVGHQQWETEYDSKSRHTRVRNSLQAVGRAEQRHMPVFVIKHPIPPYDYFKTGLSQFRRENFGRNFEDFILGVYKAYFEEHDINFMLRWFIHYQSIGPRAGDVALRRLAGRNIRSSDAEWI